MQTRQQNDALLALQHVKSLEKELSGDYINITKQFPILVRQNGLQQALGFYAGKAAGEENCAERIFLNHIAEVLETAGQAPETAILKEESLAKYMYYTRRCLEVMAWYRRFADSILDKDAHDNGVVESTNTAEGP